MHIICNYCSFVWLFLYIGKYKAWLCADAQSALRFTLQWQACIADRFRLCTVLPKFNIDFVVALLRQENAKDICVIQLPPEIKYCNYFIIVSGSSTRHLHAMAHYMLKMYKHHKEESDPRTRIEGKETDDWLCIDFGSIVIHFMLPETRDTYELEKLWTLGSYDDQLAQMIPQSLPEDFIFGLTPNSSDQLETRT
uniref:Mitochondrial assembly of ribosomal large subunit protein 1 n=2 Tax=Strigidae TaxID=30459 RepID=A0A8D0KPR2_STROC